MNKKTKIVTFIAVVGGLLTLGLGSIALAAEPEQPVQTCDQTMQRARLHLQDGTCGTEAVGEQLGEMNRARVQNQAAECNGECEEPLCEQLQLRERTRAMETQQNVEHNGACGPLQNTAGNQFGNNS